MNSINSLVPAAASSMVAQLLCLCWNVVPFSSTNVNVDSWYCPNLPLDILTPVFVQTYKNRTKFYGRKKKDLVRVTHTCAANGTLALCASHKRHAKKWSLPSWVELGPVLLSTLFSALLLRWAFIFSDCRKRLIASTSNEVFSVCITFTISLSKWWINHSEEYSIIRLMEWSLSTSTGSTVHTHKIYNNNNHDHHLWGKRSIFYYYCHKTYGHTALGTHKQPTITANSSQTPNKSIYFLSLSSPKIV